MVIEYYMRKANKYIKSFASLTQAFDHVVRFVAPIFTSRSNAAYSSF
jgi:hypothetical protein